MFFRPLRYLLLGFLYTISYATLVNHWHVPDEIEGKTVTVSGIIQTIPNKQEHHQSFIFKAKEIIDEQGKNHGSTKIKLSWFNKYADLKVGDEWRFAVRLKKPHGLRNPGSFDYEKWLFQQHIRATGYIINHPQNQIIQSNHWIKPIDRIREKIFKQISNHFEQPSLKGFLSALSIGVRHDILPSQWSVFQKTGTSHLIAISGLHIGLVAGLFFGLSTFLWRLSSKLCLQMPAKKAGAIGGIVGAIIYSVLAGFSLSTQRALIMIVIVMCSVFCRRQISTWHGILLALTVVLICDPLSTLSSGFWLSFLAVSIIFYGVSGRLKMRTLWWRWGRVQFVLSIGMFSVAILYFNQYPWISFAANFIAIPWVGCIIVPLCILGSVLSLFSIELSQQIFFYAEKLLHPLWQILEPLSKIESFQWQSAIVSPWVLCASSVGVLLLLAPKGIPNRWMGVVFFLPLFFYSPVSLKQGELNFTLLDVGQGLASVVQTQNHSLIFDTGVKSSPDFDMGMAVVIPFLRKQGIKKIDTLVISHGDNDHIGGASSILKTLPVKKILTGVPERFGSKNTKRCLKGQHWEWDGVEFRVLHPDGLASGNNGSCVIRVSNGEHSILMTGDIERPAEKSLIEKQSKLLASDVLVAPHHGSRTSSSKPFIDLVNPQIVLFPVGYRNRYRFPSQVILKRYFDMNIAMFDTANDGAISFKLAKHLPIIADRYRHSRQRYYHSRGLTSQFSPYNDAKSRLPSSQYIPPALQHYLT